MRLTGSALLSVRIVAALGIVPCLGAPAQHLGPVTDIVTLDDRIFSLSQAGVLEGLGESAKSIFRGPFRILCGAVVRGQQGGGPQLLLGGGDPGLTGRVGLLDLNSGAFVSRTVARDLVYDLAIDPNDRVAALACADHRVLLLDLPGLGESPLQPQHRHTAPVRSVGFSPDGAYLASGGLDGLLFLSAFPTLGPARVLREHSDAVECLAFSPDSETLASGARDGRVRLHTVGGRLLRSYAGLGRQEDGAGLRQGPAQVLSLAWQATPARLVVGTSTGGLYDLSMTDSTWVTLVSGSGEGPVHSLHFAGTGRLLVGRDGVVRLRTFSE